MLGTLKCSGRQANLILFRGMSDFVVYKHPRSGASQSISQALSITTAVTLMNVSSEQHVVIGPLAFAAGEDSRLLSPYFSIIVLLPFRAFVHRNIRCFVIRANFQRKGVGHVLDTLRTRIVVVAVNPGVIITAVMVVVIM